MIICEISHNEKKGKNMEYVILGMQKSAFTSKKNGKKYLPISVGSKDLNWTGTKAEQILLTEDVLSGMSIETESGEIYAKDGKTYYINIEYNNRGFIVDARVYNKDTGGGK